MSSTPHDLGGDPAASPRSSRDRARMIAVAVLVVLAALLALFNLDTVKVSLIFASVRMPLIILIVICLLLGAAIGAFLSRRGDKRRD
jgi:uncharacterized integral membrane protein